MRTVPNRIFCPNRQRGYLFARVLCFLLLAPAAVVAAPPTDSTILPQGETLQRLPGSGETIRIQRESRGHIVQRQGDWVKVQMEGYVWRAHTVDLMDASAHVGDDLPPLPIQLKDCTIHWQPQDFTTGGAGRAMVVANLIFANRRPEPVS